MKQECSQRPNGLNIRRMLRLLSEIGTAHIVPLQQNVIPEGADTDISGDKNLINRNVRLSEEDGEKFLKSGKLPVVA